MGMTFNMVGGGGGKAVLAVAVTNGTATSVTATKSGVTVSLTYSGGIWSAELPSFGAWTVSTTDGTRSQTDTVNASVAGLYTLTLRLQDVPNAYTQLEWLQGTSAQCINTQYTPNANTKCQVTAMFLNNTTWVSLFGSNGDTFGIQRGDDNLLRYMYAALYSQSNLWNSASTGIGISLNTKYDFILDAPNKQFKIGTTTRTVTKGSTAPTQPIYLFRKYGESWSSDSVRIYASKIESSSTLVRNFVPARRNSDSVLGMYDTVNNVFYTNAGTGTFTAGPAV